MHAEIVWPTTLSAEIYTTCLGEWVLVATMYNVTILLLRLCYKKTRTSACFSEDAENIATQHGRNLVGDTSPVSPQRF